MKRDRETAKERERDRERERERERETDRERERDRERESLGYRQRQSTYRDTAHLKTHTQTKKCWGKRGITLIG